MKKALSIILIAMPAIGFAADNVPGAHFIENWDLDGNTAVTAEELRTKRGDVFYTFDSDDDGVLTPEEYTYFDDARAADMEGQGDQAKRSANRVQEGMTLTFNDVDGDGKVSRDEFIGQVDAWLASIDRDGDGQVTSADFGPRG